MSPQEPAQPEGWVVTRQECRICGHVSKAVVHPVVGRTDWECAHCSHMAAEDVGVYDKEGAYHPFEEDGEYA